MIQYIETEQDGRMVAIFEIEIPAEVPTPTVGGNLIVANAGDRIVGWPAKDQEQAYFVGDALLIVDSRALPAAITAALDKPRADINAVVWDAVGNLTEEYKAAEIDARTYKAGGYVGTAPRSVDSFAQHNPTGTIKTGQWAADDIIMRADAFAVAKLAMRENRFSSQSAMRAATTLAELDAAVAAWDSFIAQLRAQLGL